MYYNTSPFAAVPLKLIPGQPAYVFGSWPSNVAPTKLWVTNVALTTDVATLNVTLNEGNVPAVGSLITVNGTSTESGEFNVVNTALTGVDLNAEGVGTVTFALSESDVASTPDGGNAIVPQPEVADALIDGASLAVGLPYTTPFTTQDVAQSVTAIVSFPSKPTTATISLQGAIQNYDSEYQTLDTVATVAGGDVTLSFLNYSGKFNFYRLLAADVDGGTNPSIIGKILI